MGEETTQRKSPPAGNTSRLRLSRDIRMKPRDSFATVGDLWFLSHALSVQPRASSGNIGLCPQETELSPGAPDPVIEVTVAVSL